MSLLMDLYVRTRDKAMRGLGEHLGQCELCGRDTNTKGQPLRVTYSTKYKLILCANCKQSARAKVRASFGEVCQHPDGCPRGWTHIYDGERYCTGHAMRLRENRPLGSVGILKDPDRVHSYEAAHSYLKATRGNLSRLDIPCAMDCGRTAAQWALQWRTCEHLAIDDSGKPATDGMLYCSKRDSGCYVPMCTDCHRREDRRSDVHAKKAEILGRD